MAALRLGQAPDEARIRSERICSELAGLDDPGTGGRLGGYLAIRGEVCIDSELARRARCGVETYVPGFDGARVAYRFRRWEPGRVTRKGPDGVAEPVEGDWCEASHLAAIWVPGVAFDSQGRRLGHGGGHYDRMLSAATNTKKIGIAFSWQVVPELPAMPWDVSMDLVITEEEILRCAAVRDC